MEGTQDLFTESQQLKNSAKRNKIILLSLFVLLLCSIVFAYVQRREVQLQKTLSENLTEDLQRTKIIAEQAQAEAMVQRELAARNQEKYYQAMQECEQKSK